MEIIVDQIGKRFDKQWVFRNLSHTFSTGTRYAITGANGAGKSTFLKILSGGLTPSKGTILFKDGNASISTEDIAQKVSFAAPYVRLIEDFTLEESLAFHWKFKKMLIPDIDTFLTISYLKEHRKKQIKHFSSGMAQRLKVALAILSQSEILILDEPTSNFDQKAKDWYQSLMETYTKDRIVLIGSNVPEEYTFCEQVFSIERK